MGMWPPGRRRVGRSRVSPRRPAASTSVTWWRRLRGSTSTDVIDLRQLGVARCGLPRRSRPFRLRPPHDCAQGVGASPLTDWARRTGKVEMSRAQLATPKGTANLPTVLSAAEIDGLLDGSARAAASPARSISRSSGHRVALRQWDPGRVNYAVSNSTTSTTAGCSGSGAGVPRRIVPISGAATEAVSRWIREGRPNVVTSDTADPAVPQSGGSLADTA